MSKLKIISVSNAKGWYRIRGTRRSHEIEQISVWAVVCRRRKNKDSDYCVVGMLGDDIGNHGFDYNYLVDDVAGYVHKSELDGNFVNAKGAKRLTWPEDLPGYKYKHQKAGKKTLRKIKKAKKAEAKKAESKKGAGKKKIASKKVDTAKDAQAKKASVSASAKKQASKKSKAVQKKVAEKSSVKSKGKIAKTLGKTANKKPSGKAAGNADSTGVRQAKKSKNSAMGTGKKTGSGLGRDLLKSDPNNSLH